MQYGTLIDLPKITDQRGNLSFVEIQKHVPFNIGTVCWICDLPKGHQSKRQAFEPQHELVIALAGSFDVVLNNGIGERKYSLNSAEMALYIPNVMWYTFQNYSADTICLVISSSEVYESDQRPIFFDLDKICGQDLTPNAFSKMNDRNRLSDCSLIELPNIKSKGGDISFVNSNDGLPFEIKRVFYIYDVPTSAQRGMHAHYRCHEILVALSGSFDVELDDGENKKTIRLDSPSTGLYIPSGIWAIEKEYSSAAICLALASDAYQEDDYIKTYQAFKTYHSDGN